jgi:BirA family transcriptional regulator, biotin operon repressor / biotin---[acetyl-CoA-carboxylase] ligase
MKFKKFKFKKVRNTNDTAIRIIKSSNHKFGMVISKNQINGKGQYGRKWISYKGNLFVSFFHELRNLNLSISVLTKINCLLVKKSLEDHYKGKITIKKPNDLLIDQKKICGILQEIITISNQKFLIIGIGINLIKCPKIKKYPTTNLFKLINKRVDKSIIEKKLKLLFEKNLLRMYKINKLNKIK